MNRKQVLLLNKNQYWNEYTEKDNKIIVNRKPPFEIPENRIFQNIPTTFIEKGVGFLELCKGQEWKALGYNEKDNICLSNAEQEYEILNIDKQVAKISLLSTPADFKKKSTPKNSGPYPCPRT